MERCSDEFCVQEMSRAWENEVDGFPIYLYSVRASDLMQQCESPIEGRLAAHLLKSHPKSGGYVVKGSEEFYSSFEQEKCIEITAQARIERWRVDFLLRVKRGSHYLASVIVECDGHDFHERTKEQAAHDRGRDRALSAMGYHILRFTGSEIFRDAAKCAAEVGNYIDGIPAQKRAANG